jgi:hypothetical protein
VSCRTWDGEVNNWSGISNPWTSSMSGRCRPLSRLEVSEIGVDVEIYLLLLTDGDGYDDDKT